MKANREALPEFMLIMVISMWLERYALIPFGILFTIFLRIPAERYISK